MIKYLEKVMHKFSNWDEVKEAAALGLLNLEVTLYFKTCNKGLF